MDIHAINMCTDKDLKQLGLTKKGDILSLKNFCEKHESETKIDEKKQEKKRLLQSILNIGNSSKRSKPSPVTVKLPVVSSPSGKTR